MEQFEITSSLVSEVVAEVNRYSNDDWSKTVLSYCGILYDLRFAIYDVCFIMEYMNPVLSFLFLLNVKQNSCLFY